ncbi:MAG: DNA-directed RNA polymerase subunit alpha [Desulfobulbaceae bacterium A2]|nr:MAG: DNA-directed RNA polymerase subunit alpha [Desulfobulbaceae bacterium A2]
MEKKAKNSTSLSRAEESSVHKHWSDLIAPERYDIERSSHTDKYAKIICHPLERGFATTIGNSLRRILLSSIRGAAITSVRFEEALHEFTYIRGVKEDVADIILNLKMVRIKLLTPRDCHARIEKKGPGIVTAGDIVGNSLSIMNPDLYICEITENSTFRVDLDVRWGKGYVPADRQKSDAPIIGEIPIDAIYSPIRRIQYVVSQARVGQQTDYDKLTMELETDGSIRPENALAYAAKILKEQMNIFINFDENAVEALAEEQSAESSDGFHPFLDKHVEDLELSVRSANCLKNANIAYIGQLVQKSDAEMLKTKNFGRKSLNEIKALLTEHSLTLGMKIDGWAPPSDREGAEEPS